jgi:hypothetical protein
MVSILLTAEAGSFIHHGTKLRCQFDNIARFGTGIDGCPLKIILNQSYKNIMQEKGTISIHTENIFPIIKKFLYSDNEIFLRELVSNAVDATQKIKRLASLANTTANWATCALK